MTKQRQSKVTLIISSLYTIVLLISCGTFEDHSKTSSVSSTFKNNFTNKIELLPFADSECIASPKVGKLGEKVQIWTVNSQGNPEQNYFDLSDISMDELKSVTGTSMISGVVANQMIRMKAPNSFTSLRYSQTFRGSSIIANNNDSQNPLNQKVSICHQSGGYPRHSIENMALASVFALKMGQDFLAKIQENNANLKDIPEEFVSISLQPTIIDLSRKSANVLSDNAYYSPVNHFSKNSQISILPHSKVLFESMPVYFWEQPFVILHEFAHGIFSRLIPNAETVSEDRPISQKALLQSYAEGFSDLFAYYRLSQADSVFPNYPLFFPQNIANRDISSDFYIVRKDSKSHYYPKTISHELLNTIAQSFDKEDKQQSEGIHHLGAIIAYHLNSALNFIPLSNQDKATIIMLWSKSINQTLPSMTEKEASELLLFHLQLFCEEFTNYLSLNLNITLNEKFQEKIKNQLTYWFDQKH